MIKPLLALGALGLLALLGRRPRPQPQRTAWTGAGLPTPVAAPPELLQLAGPLAAALKSAPAAHATAGLVRQFQRRAGLVSVRDESGIATASGQYDALTRQALGYYGRIWQEETP